MKPSDDREAAAVFDFIDEYLADLEAGRVRTLADYLARSPGFEDAVAREYLSLRGEALRPDPADPAHSRGASGSAAEDRRIGPYRLLRELGRGGQGSVWLAEDVRIARRVALKVLASRFESVSDERRSRFRREAEVIARLEHASICPIFDADIECETPWIAMRFVEGRTLAQLVGEARAAISAGRAPEHHGDDSQASEVTSSWPPRTTLDVHRTLLLFERCARALHAAHEAGVVHRDVKPGNLIVTPEGKPVILDFGLARDDTSDTGTITESGEVFGTPAYMSPEQLSGASSELDRRTDVYSLGVALYEALTLNRPFDSAEKPGDKAALYLRIRDDPAADARTLNPALSLDVEVVLETAMEKDRARRYPTALEFAEDLRRIREYEPIHARPASVGLRFARWTRRHPALAITTIGTIVSLSVGLALTLFLLRAEERALRVALGEHLAHRCEALTREDPSAALLLGIQAVERSPNDLTRAALVEALENCWLAARISPGNEGIIRDMALSTDGSRLALARDDGNVYVYDPRDSRGIATLGPFEGRTDRESMRAVAWRSDGALLVAYKDGAVAAWDVATAKVVRSGRVPFSPTRLELDARGTTLVATDGTDADDVRAVALDPDALAVRCGLNLDGERLAGIVLDSVDELAFAWSRDATTVSVRSTRTGERVEELGPVPGIRCVAAQRPASPRDDSPADHREIVAVGSRDGSVTLFEARAPAQVKESIDGRRFWFREAFALDGPVDVLRVDPYRVFASTTDTIAPRSGAPARSCVRLFALALARRQNDPVRRIELGMFPGSTVTDACSSPDGLRLAVAMSDNSLRLFDLEQNGAQTLLTGFHRPEQLAWMPDGTRLWSRSNGQFADAWFGHGAPDAMHIAAGTRPIRAAALMPKGAGLVTVQTDPVHVDEEAGEETSVVVVREDRAPPIAGDPAGVEAAGAHDVRRHSERMAEVVDAWEFGPSGLSRSRALSFEEHSIPADIDLARIARPKMEFTADGEGVWWLVDGLNVGVAYWGTIVPRGQLRSRVQSIGPPLAAAEVAGLGGQKAELGTDGIVHVGQGHVVRPTTGPVGTRASSLALDGRRERLAIGMQDGRILLVHSVSGELQSTISDPKSVSPITALAFRSGTDELAAFGDDRRLRFWNVTNGERVRNDVVLFEPRAVVYSLDGRQLLATGRSGGGAVRVFQLEPFAPRGFDTYHKQELVAGEFSADGRYVLTASLDGSVFVRESSSGLIFARRVFPGRAVVAAHFDSERENPRILALTDDGDVRIWPLDPLPAAKARYRRQLVEWEIARERKLAAPLDYP